MKLKLEIELKHIDGPELDLPDIFTALELDLNGSTIYVESEEHEDEGVYSIESVTSLD